MLEIEVEQKTYNRPTWINHTVVADMDRPIECDHGIHVCHRRSGRNVIVADMVCLNCDANMVDCYCISVSHSCSVILIHWSRDGSSDTSSDRVQARCAHLPLPAR